MIRLTPGDPGGIGPWVMLRAWAAQTVPPLLCGDPRIWLRAAGQLEMDADAVEAACVGCAGDLPLPTAGQPTAAGARLAWQALDEALDAVLADGGAIVTGPIAKAGMLEVGFAHAGHTEYLAERAGVDRVLMVMSAPGFHVGLHTVHIPLAEVPAAVRGDVLERDVEALAAYLARLGEPGTIAVCGLNPHAGESGRIGFEEEQRIAPAVARLRARGVAVEGPLPGDTVFHAMVEGRFAAVLAMYHDQGLAPFKLRHFHDGVNVTVGLPWVRTSPDHGTAFSLAAVGPAAADATSAIAAVRLARRLVQ